jgi:hypothetical protein
VTRLAFWAAFWSVLLFLPADLAQAQLAPATPPTFLTFVDTTNIAVVAPETYVTWIFALHTPTSYPSSGIMVAFDCRARKVRRLYHIVYELRGDSLGVTGPIVEDALPWVPVSVPATYNLVCEVGSHRPYEPPPQPTYPDSVALPTPKWSAS